MYILRRTQLDSLNSAAATSFHRRLAAYLRRELHEATASLTDEDLLEHIRHSEERANRYGIVSEAGVSQYVCLTFVSDQPFDELPPVKEYLEQPGVDPETKLQALIDYLDELESSPDSEPSAELLDREGD
jgi:hypothetical protein